MFFTPVIRRNAYHPGLRAVDRGLERFFQDAGFVPASQAAAQTAAKACQFEQDDTSYTLRLDVPGLTKEQLRIAIEGAVVRIESLADAPRTVKAAYEFPLEIDAGASTAKLENGVLSLGLVKKQPMQNTATLTIN